MKITLICLCIFSLQMQFLLCKRPPASGRLRLQTTYIGLCPWTPLFRPQPSCRYIPKCLILCSLWCRRSRVVSVFLGVLYMAREHWTIAASAPVVWSYNHAMWPTKEPPFMSLFMSHVWASMYSPYVHPIKTRRLCCVQQTLSSLQDRCHFLYRYLFPGQKSINPLDSTCTSCFEKPQMAIVMT